MADVIDRGVTLAERTGLEMTQISAWPATSAEVSRILNGALGVWPPIKPNTVANRGHIKILWLGPDRSLIVRPADRQQDLPSGLAARLATDIATVVDLSAGRCVFSLSGALSRDVLAKLLPLDLSESEFPVGCCAQSAMAHVGVLVHAEGRDAFEIFVHRGFARHLWDTLADAALEFVPSASDS